MTLSDLELLWQGYQYESFLQKRDEELLKHLKEREEVNMDDVVDIPDYDTHDLVEEHLSSIIVRILNTDVLKPVGAITALPKIWDMEGRVRGRGIGNNRIQFIFDKEEDLKKVLKEAPWFINGWLLTGQRWTPNPTQDFLSCIPFWVRIKGIPIHQLKDEAVNSIGSTLGRVECIELHAKNSTSLEYVRARVWLPVDEPLVFKKAARFKGGEVVIVDLDYEKLNKLCYRCKRITHDQYHCRDKQISIPHPAQASHIAPKEISSKKQPNVGIPKTCSQEGDSFTFKALEPSRDIGASHSRGRGRGRGSRGRGRGRGRSSTVHNQELTIEGEGTSEISVFHRLGGSKVKGKGILKESEWRVKELGNTHLDCSKDDEKTSNDQDIELKSQEKPKENLSSSSKKKRKSSAEKIGARKKAKFTTSVGVQMDNQRQLPEGSSNSLSSASPGPSTLDNTPFTLSSGLQVSLNPRTPRNQRFVVNLKPPASI